MLPVSPPVPVAVVALSIAGVLGELGYAGLVLLMVAETVFPPIPSEVVLPLAGYLVHQGSLSFVPALLASTLGSLIGALLLEEAARRGGRPFAVRFMRFARQDPDKLDDAERWFERRGPWIVLFGRWLPGVRSLVAIPAGILKMPRGQYVALTVLGSAVWNAALIGAGYLLGTQWKRVSDAVGSLSTPLLVLVAVALAAVLTWRALRRRARNVDRSSEERHGANSGPRRTFSPADELTSPSMRVEPVAIPSDAPVRYSRHRVHMAADGSTTCHVARYPVSSTHPRIVRIEPAEPIGEWCGRQGISEAISGGFYAKPENIPLGEFRPSSGADGHRPFKPPWDTRRGALHLPAAGTATIDRLDRLQHTERDELLQAGPLLVADGQNAVRDEDDPEGFSQTAEEFDQDLTEGRLPRLAIALGDGHWLAVAVDGRSPEDAGLTLEEFADLLIELGAHSALNLDGGSSAALVCSGTVRNIPRDDEGEALPAAGPTTSAIVFDPALR